MARVSRQEKARRRLSAVLAARDDLVAFTRLMMADPNDPDDPSRSRYAPAKHHRAIALALQELEAGNYQRLIINMPPRHGKTELATKHFIPWYAGRNPHNSVVFGTYNEKFSLDIGRAVRDVINNPAYGQVFPTVAVREGSGAADRLEIQAGIHVGGMLTFAGRGGTITGRGGDLLVIDDPIKDRKEANSAAIREQLWTWWTQVMRSRGMTDNAKVVLIQTRWHSDDLVGRITDPGNDFYDKEEAKLWNIIDLPALAFQDDLLGRAPDEPLWPERFGKTYLVSMRRSDPAGFSALYQGRPTPPGGVFFQENWIRTYRKPPTNLRIYAASDHAVSTEQDRDSTVLILAGVDDKGDIYILPEVFWQRAPTNLVVEAMLRIMKTKQPLFWWAERGHITKSFGPFLRKRMHEDHVYCAMLEIAPTADKQARAQAIQARMAMGKVWFPELAPWWPDARDELLRFPRAQHDDFVDALSLIGLGLDIQTTAGVPRSERTYRPGSFGALHAAARRHEQAHTHTQGW